MSHEQLRRMLTDSAERIEVGPAPSLAARRSQRTRVVLAAAAAAAVVAGIVVVALVPGDDDAEVAVDAPAGARQVPLLTGEPLGGAGDEALGAGRLAADDRGCALLESGGSTTPVLWPGGWTAYVVDGGLVLRDERGRVRVREGDWVEAGGGFGARRELYAGQPCAPRDGEVFRVQSEPEVVPGRPVELLTDGDRPGTGATRELGGVLARAEEDCLLLREPDGRRSFTVWPAGWSAGTDPDGVTTVRDTEGLIVAATGESVRVDGTRRGEFAYTGSYDPVDPDARLGCGRGAVFVRGVDRPRR